MKINYKKNPFNLIDTDINWVETTYEKMTLEEKIGQLFFPIVFTGKEEELKQLLDTKHIGGVLYREGEAREIQKNHKILQTHSRIPLLIGSNLEQGGVGAAVEGTYYGKQMAIAATNDKEKAYRLGKVACSEGAAVGVNMSFAPIVDIDYNFRNPITNIRTFGNNPQRVEEMGLEYLRAAKEEGVATAVKHFPGDGCDERDQHLLTSVNDMSCEKWDETFGKIYKSMIDAGTLCVMTGHIAMPAYEERYSNNPIKEVVPATLSKILLQKVLREKLNFNGLILTDATPMVGFCCAMERELAIPKAIENGCDMILFNRDLEEDYDFMMKGYKNGILSPERLEAAVKRILATKASLKLHKKQEDQTLVPNEESLEILCCDKHRKWARECADEAITLVKDTQDLLPLNVNSSRRVLLQILGDFPSNDRVYNQFESLLSKEGFEITKYQPEDFSVKLDNVTDIKRKYDLVMYIGNVDNASNKTVTRINWHTFFGLGNNMPWFVKEVPTVFVSVGNPYHLIDTPMIKTFINGYCNTPDIIEGIVEKLLGRSEFKGINPIDPFCGRKDTTY